MEVSGELRVPTALNASVVTGCKRRNLSSGIVNCENQRATMLDILSENRKKEYPKSVPELLRLGEKRFVQEVCYFMNKIRKAVPPSPSG
jgi:hypothetical protein